MDEAWFRVFRKDRLFPNPLLVEQHGISFFINNPSNVGKIRAFSNNNLANLTIGLVQDFILNVEVPRLIHYPMEQSGDELTKEEFLKENGLKKICSNTVHRWMRFLGFKRDRYRKGFYTDNHEREDVVVHRIEYCIQFLKLEIRAAVWVQLMVTKATELKAANRIMEANDGYRFERDGVAFAEYHVDDIEDAFSLQELNDNAFGGNVSVRKEPNDKQIMMWGQDEIVSHEKQLSSMTWYGSKGQSH